MPLGRGRTHAQNKACKSRKQSSRTRARFETTSASRAARRASCYAHASAAAAKQPAPTRDPTSGDGKRPQILQPRVRRLKLLCRLRCADFPALARARARARTRARGHRAPHPKYIAHRKQCHRGRRAATMLDRPPPRRRSAPPSSPSPSLSLCPSPFPWARPLPARHPTATCNATRATAAATAAATWQPCVCCGRVAAVATVVKSGQAAFAAAKALAAAGMRGGPLGPSCTALTGHQSPPQVSKVGAIARVKARRDLIVRRPDRAQRKRLI